MASPAAAGDAPARLSFKEKRELEQLPDRIALIEAEQAALQAQLANPAFYQGPAEQIRGVQTRLADLEAELDSAMARWEALEARAG